MPTGRVRQQLPGMPGTSEEATPIRPERPLRRRVAELLTVFSGVVLAFLADDFRERLGDDRAERVVLAGLRADFAQNSRQLAVQRRFNARVETAATGLLDLLGQTDDGVIVSVHDTLLMATAVGVNSYEPVRGTLDALLNSGELRLIRDARLRTLLAEWPAALADTRESQRRAIDAVDDHLLPVFIGAGAPLDRILDRERYLAWSRLELPADVETWVTPIVNTPEIRTVLALRVRQQSIATAYIERLTGLEARIQELLASD